MDMVLLDWTRMGHVYCLAGAVQEDGGFRIVRPLLRRRQSAPVRNTGWSPFLFDGRQRWEIFTLVGTEPAEPEPPHLEDVWVRAMLPQNRSADQALRRAILQATTVPKGQPVFGSNLTLTPSSAHLAPGCGNRSLATLIIPSAAIRFSASWRERAAEPDVRASLGFAPLGGRMLPVKDHHLICRAEQKTAGLTQLATLLNEMVRAMGPEVAVRLGLSRAFPAEPGGSHEFCWLMIDGFFSPIDP